jgi:hypothetical protein
MKTITLDFAELALLCQIVQDHHQKVEADLSQGIELSDVSIELLNRHQDFVEKIWKTLKEAQASGDA